MFRIIILTCFVAVCMVNLIFDQAFAICSNAVYDRLAELDGLSCLTSDVVIEKIATSIISCLGMCYGKRCATVFYKPDTGSCTGCYTWYADNNGLPTSDGSVTAAYRFHFDCGADEGRYNTSCYRISDEIGNAQSANRYCTSTDNRFPAVPETLDELSYIGSFVNSANLPHSCAYIGVDDRDIEGTWTTDHGQLLNYRRWAQGEPNGANGGRDENCMIVGSLGNMWDDDCFFNEVKAVCEQDMIAM